MKNLILMSILFICSFSKAHDYRLTDQVWYLQNQKSDYFQVNETESVDRLVTLRFNAQGGFQLEGCNLMLAKVTYKGLNEFSSKSFVNTFKNCSTSINTFENSVFSFFKQESMENHLSIFKYKILKTHDNWLQLRINNVLGKELVFTNTPYLTENCLASKLLITNVKDQNYIDISGTSSVGKFCFRIFNLLGKEVSVQSEVLKDGLTRIQTSFLESGVYILAIQGEQVDRRCFKFIL